MNDQLTWRKSSYSGQTGGDCVEVAKESAAVVRVRDSKAGRTGPQLAFPAAAWQAFVVEVAKGEFDSLEG